MPSGAPGIRPRVRIVLDTNVVLSALPWRGTPYQLLDAIHQRPSAQLYCSAALLDELADVLTRPSATKRLALIGKTARAVLADYVTAVELVEPLSVPRVVPDDLIVSSDSDLLSMEAIRTCLWSRPRRPCSESKPTEEQRPHEGGRQHRFNLLTPGRAALHRATLAGLSTLIFREKDSGKQSQHTLCYSGNDRFG